MRWRHRAACRSEDPELFFPIGTTELALDQLASAKSVCRRCPVAGECLAWALDTDQRHGVWGGLSEVERHELRLRNHRISGSARPVLLSVSDHADALIGMGRQGRDPVR
jgi:WhiB family transcriptional regulator, redox-sensing transcriptional regulator